MALMQQYQNQMQMQMHNNMNNGANGFGGMQMQEDTKPHAEAPPRKRRRELPQTMQDLIKPDFHQVTLNVERDIKDVIGVKLDKDEQICRLNLTPAGCPLGPLHCPLRHTMPSKLNFQPPSANSRNASDGDPRFRTTVCKHWLRGLCKKGDSCEFLHEYNLRKMPECWWYAKYGYCSQGDECLYMHPKERKIECPDYQRGFCKLGPECPRKHSRRVACQLFMSGFCPRGPECTLAHPKWALPTKEDYEPEQQQRELGPPPPGFGRFGAPGGGEGGYGGGGGGGYGGGYNAGGGRGAGADGGAGGRNFERRNLDEVTCFKCGERGHYANMCRNRNVPGNRGGMERGPGGPGDGGAEPRY